MHKEGTPAQITLAIHRGRMGLLSQGTTKKLAQQVGRTQVIHTKRPDN